MNGFAKSFTTALVIAILFLLLFILSRQRPDVVSPFLEKSINAAYSSSEPFFSTQSDKAKGLVASSDIVSDDGDLVDIGTVDSVVATNVSFASSQISTVVNHNLKTSLESEPKQYNGHELSHVSPYIRPRREMYKNPRIDAFGAFSLPVEKVKECTNGTKEVDEPKYLYTCAFLLMDRFLSEKMMGSEQGELILKKVRNLYIKSASLGHVSAMDDLSVLIAYHSVGRENFYLHDERYLQSKIESMAWFFVGEFVGASNFSSYEVMKILLAEADEDTIRKAEELGLFYIDFYGIPRE